ncbi:Protein MNN4 [Penicillium subrubescens]|uniref:Protein MNN4 n=1 Tax=Penicillium subrubescens TaxID=1316194 RepID=A0A1Q5SZS7_9EURO|nr:Protein MNN4 [Penicillium subrubescens]
MHWRTWTTLASALWSTAVTALPSSETPDGSSSSFNTPYIDPTLKDPLWLKYGLNASAEYKYFHEPGRDDILGHYDIRFFTTPVSDAERAETLTHMIRAYLNFFDENDLETWIAHGTLLGWWWNGKILPWDWDMDTQVPDTTLAYLADHYNQTIVEYVIPGGKEKRDYLLDINPWSRQRERGQGHNIIDARFIDVTTGLYIDITGLSRLELDDHPDIWQCKNFHKYRLKDIYPLRRTTFEGAPAKVPFQYDALLMEEYTEDALTTTNFHK